LEAGTLDTLGKTACGAEVPLNPEGGAFAGCKVLDINEFGRRF
jgi:hypothetical protein